MLRTCYDWIRRQKPQRARRGDKPTARRARPVLEYLEDRVTPSVAATFVNDNWNLINDVDHSGTLTVGDQIRNDNDTVAAGTITATYGVTGFGTVTTESVPGTVTLTADPSADNINDAIANTNTGGTVTILQGNYNENVTINKNLTLQSNAGFAQTTITGVSNGSLGTIVVTNNTTAVTIGGVGKGLTINGIDNPNPAVESAAIYFQGDVSGAQVIGNRIVANGEAAILTEFAANVSDLTISGNQIAGKTFTGSTPGGTSLDNQFTEANVPRQLVTISGGDGGGNTSNITFTNNIVTGVTGGVNASGEIGDNLVVIDSVGATITGNTFAGTIFGSDATASGGRAQLAAHGTDTTISGNTFISTNVSTAEDFQLKVGASTLASGNLADTVAANTFDRGVFVDDGTTVALSIQLVIDNVSAGATVNVLPGSHNESVDVNKAITLEGSATITGTLTVSDSGAVLSPGLDAGQAGFISSGNLSLVAGSKLDIDLNGRVPGVSFDRLNVNGTVDLGGATLVLDANFKAEAGDHFIIIDNDGTDAVQGTFAGLAEGSTITTADGQKFRITYHGGDGNDVVLTALTSPANRIIVVGAGAGAGPHVIVFNADGSIRFSFFAFAAEFHGGVTVATGDVNGDGVQDIIVGSAQGSSHVKVFDGATGAQIASFLAFAPSFHGGVTVASGDVNGDGLDDVIVGVAGNGPPHVKVVDATKLTQTQANGQIADSALLASFYAFAPAFVGGVSVAAGDINGDGLDDVIVGANEGNEAHVIVVDATKLTQTQANGQIADAALLRSFLAFDNSIKGGVTVASGDVNGDGYDDIIVATAHGAHAQVRVFSGLDNSILADFQALGPPLKGVRVGTADFDGDGKADLIIGAAPGLGPFVRVLKGPSMDELDSFFAFGNFQGGVFVSP